MPTEERDPELERLKEAIGKAQMAPQTKPSCEDEILFYMKKTLDVMRQCKPEIRSEITRRYAVAITEMEKTYAYFYTYVVNFDSEVDNFDR